MDTLFLINTIRDENSLTNAHVIRNQMETILFGRPIRKFENIKSYIEEVRDMDSVLSDKIDSMFKMGKPVEFSSYLLEK